MKRFICQIVAVVSVLFAVPLNAAAPVSNGDECREIDLSKDTRDLVLNSTEDPGQTLQKAPHATRVPPAEIRCASKLWQRLHPPPAAKLTRAERRAAAKQARATAKVTDVSTGSGGRTMSGPLSPAGQRVLSQKDVTGQAFIPTVYAGPPVDHEPVRAVRTPPLRKVRPIPPPQRTVVEKKRRPSPVRPVPPTEVGGPDGPRQEFQGSLVSAPTPAGLSFDGVGIGLGGYAPSSNPPDVNGRVGGSQYVQWNNVSFAIFNKTTGALEYGPAAGNTLFQSLGGPCATFNDGDPVVSYDILAGRWVLSQFLVGSSPNYSHQCFAVSVTDDATGEYYLYDFVTDPVNFVDYPHTGVWPDGYYMTTHVFNAAGTAMVAARVHVFEREQMIQGLPARQVQADLKKYGGQFQYGFVPADLDSSIPPPTGEASFVIGPHPQFSNRTATTRVAVTWGVTPAIALTEDVITTVGITTPTCVNNTTAQQNRDCVPQPSPAVGADYLDNIAFHYMYRLGYRNFGGAPVQESLVVSAPTGGSASNGAIKWIEFRNAGNSTATPTVYQSGTFDPDSAYRWLPSIAMDKDHNIAVGYSKSSTSIFPGIYMTGRLGTDALNTMGAEATVQAGSGSQTTGAGNRWGDYSAMTLDPVDQCTFWYTNEYLKTSGAFNWSTRIATYKFPSCTAAPAWGTISGNITSCATGAPLSGVIVTLSNGYSGATDASGNYSILVPAGTYSASATAEDRNCSSGSPATVSVIATSGGTTTQAFCMSGSSNLQTSGLTIDDASNGNNNGVVNRNECVKLTVPLVNAGCANESAISATLTTSTPNVTITQATSAYPNLVIDAGGANSTPFQFQTSSSFVCGTVINFTLTVNYASGSKPLAISIPTCAGGANQTIPSSSLTAADLTQSDRLGRDGVPSTCANKTGSGGFAGTKYYKTFNFTNSSAVATCYTVAINAALGGAGDIQSAAYSPTYNPAALSTNLLGDSGVVGLGTSVASVTYSFTVPALANFVIVVNTAGTTTSSVFSGTVSGFPDTTAGPGACPVCTPPATPTASNGGPYCAGATIALSTPTVSGATYAWTGPNGFSSSLQNPTRTNATTADAGTYSVTVTVAGCTSAAGTTSVVVNQTATPAASNGGPYCAGATIALSTPTVASATYAWTGPNGFTSSQQNPTRSNATTADAGTYSVTVTANGCASAAGSTSVVVNPIPATPTASNTGPYCSGATISLSTPTVASATYAWTGPNGFTSSVQNPTRSSATTADAGTYSVTVTVSGCTSAAGTTSVVVNQTPATPTASNGGPYCAGATIALATPTVASATYAWTGPNGFTSSQQNPTRSNATTADAGTYSVTATVNGCTSAAGSTNVVVNAIPATPTASNGGPYCEGATISLATATVSGATYAWTGPNGFTSALQNPTRSNATTADAGTYSVTVTVSGCTSAAGTTNVVVNVIPATPTANNGGPYCEGATIQLSTPSVSGATYSWTGPNGFTSSTQNATRSSITTADAGTYSVTISVNGCTSAAGTTSVAVNATPATPAASNGGAYCEGATISLSTATVSGATYAWTGPNGFTSALQNPTRSSATTADAGTYSVTVTVSGCTSAAGTTNVVVNVIPATPTANNGGPYCPGATIALTTATVSGATYTWTGPNGFNSSAQNPTRANATLNDAGTYSVTITVSGCTSVGGTTNVVVNAGPAAPTITPGGPTTFCEDGSVLLTSSSATANQWFLNGNPIDGATEQTFRAFAGGDYTVVFTNGCSTSSAPTTVTVNPNPTPVITPSGPTTFCSGGSVTLTSNFATGNQWYRTGTLLAGETSPTLIVTTSGHYSLLVTSPNGCIRATTTIVLVHPKPNATITSASPMFADASAGASVNHTCAGATFVWSITGGTITSGHGTPIVMFTAGGAGTLTLTVTVTNEFGCSDTKSVDITVQQASFGAPPFLEATTGGTSTASLTWASVTSANHYEIYRSTDNVNWSLRGTNTLPTFSDSGLTASTTYLFKVRAIKADTTASAYSAINAATTIALSDDPLSACGTLIKAVHITQLRTAINTARTTVGLTAFSFTDPSLSGNAVIRVVHMTELRTTLSSFLSAIAVTPAYTDPTIVAGTTVVKRTHLQQLRDLVD